jgi:glycerophosphoryl diester phosphodiesterase
VGHRGALYEELENTLAGFQYCIDIGADAVELDVFYIANELIVFHGGGTDQNPGDLTDYCLGHDNRTITDCTSLAQIQSLPFDPSCPELACPADKIQAGSIPTLSQVLELIQQQKSDLVVKIELKGEGTVRPVLNLVNKMNMQHQCHFASFAHARIALVRELHPEVHSDTGTHVYRTGALFKDVPDDFIDRAVAVGASEVHLPYSTCTLERIDAIHAAGMGSMAWFRGPVGMVTDITTKFVGDGNEDETMYRTVMETGVQQLCCNRPDLLAAMLKKQKKEAS